MSESKGGLVAVTGIECGSERKALLRECGRALLGILYGEPDAQQRVVEIDRKLARRAELKLGPPASPDRG
jgi:hypothetical protein